MKTIETPKALPSDVAKNYGKDFVKINGTVLGIKRPGNLTNVQKVALDEEADFASDWDGKHVGC